MKRLVVAAGLFVFALSATAADRKPEDIYPKTCALCHANAGTGAPLAGDAKAWEPRLAKGIDTLVTHATNGFNAMPPKGMCFDCTPDEFKALIQFMSTPK
jgi:cytochrome c5